MKHTPMIAGMLLSIFFIVGTAEARETFTQKMKPGEDLSAFSYRIYGTHKRWKEIYDLNKDVISDPNHVEPGTVLKLVVHQQMNQQYRPAAGAQAPVQEVRSAIDEEAVAPNTPAPASAKPTLVTKAGHNNSAPESQPADNNNNTYNAVKKPTHLTPYKDIEIP